MPSLSLQEQAAGNGGGQAVNEKAARVAWAAMMVVGAASAAEAPAHAVGAAPLSQPTAGQTAGAAFASKMRLVKLLLEQSPSLQRIPASDNAKAKETLAQAQARYDQAVGESAAGHAEVAQKLLDEALRLIVAASHLEPNAAAVTARERARSLELREAIGNFQGLHKNMMARMQAKNPKTPPPELDQTGIARFMNQAAAQEAEGKLREANASLTSAYMSVVQTLNTMLKAETLVYDLKFNTPAEEFQYEMARYRSYEELIPIALAQLQPTRETGKLSETLVRKSHGLRDQAQQQADGGDHRAALKSLQEADAQLQSALRVVGVAVPSMQESKP